MSDHEYFTRSKNPDLRLDFQELDFDSDDDDDDDEDEDGNLEGLIDYECEEEYSEKMLNEELDKLRGTKVNKKKDKKKDKTKDKKKDKTKEKKGKDTEELNNKTTELFLSYIMMNVLSEMDMKTPRRNKKKSYLLSKKNNSPMKIGKSKKGNIEKIEEEIKGVEKNCDITIEELVIDSETPSNCKEKDKEFNDDDEEDLDEEDLDDEDLDLDLDDEDLDLEDEDLEEEDLEDLEDEDDEEEDFNEEEDFDDEEDDEEEDDEEEDFNDEEEDIQMSPKIGEEEEEETSDEEYETYDEYDDEFCELTTLEDDDDKELDYFSNLPEDFKKNTIMELKKIKDINDTDTPLRFKVLGSEMSIKSKSIAINNIDKLGEMDVSSDEHYKMNKWIDGLIKIPFGKNIEIPVNDSNSIEEKRDYIINAKKTLDKAIYGHNEAKQHILQVIGKWIKNPKSQGNVLAIQGPMGNGKTTLVKEGISKAIGRPFAFIALGGASDSAFFDGHSYTYIGSHWGRVIDILIESKCMNPVIYFDELDKVSETHKGDEIIHLLTHLTDPSQNNVFQDNYFPGIEIDVSKALFIFSFNEEEKVNRILKDRMYVINTKGFKVDDKLSITKDYLLPELLETFLFTKEEIIFPDDTIKMIIEKYTLNEEGVRNLKRSLETIISKINIYNLSYDRDDNNNKDNKKSLELEFELKDFSIPFTITEEIAEKLLSLKKDSDKPPEHMYM